MKRFEEAMQINEPTKRLVALQELQQELWADYKENREIIAVLIGKNGTGPLPTALAGAMRQKVERRKGSDWTVVGPRADSEPGRCLKMRGAPEKGWLLPKMKVERDVEEVQGEAQKVLRGIVWYTV